MTSTRKGLGNDSFTQPSGLSAHTPSLHTVAVPLRSRGGTSQRRDKTTPSNTTPQSGGFEQFLEDVAPFFYRRQVTYVDVGAYTGEVFEKVLSSSLKVGEAHIVEPNADALEVARQRIATQFSGPRVSYYQLAIGARRGRVCMRSAKTMTKVVGPATASKTKQQKRDPTLFGVDCTTLDLLSKQITERYISLLKIDVEGYESEVLAGAEGLLAEERVDVVYIEAGTNPEGTQQRYYRFIEDALRKHGYRLFRIYEQHHEWLEDSPLLRRVNLAFMSRKFANAHPYRLTIELHRRQKELEALQQEVGRSSERLAGLDEQNAHLVVELQKAQAQLDKITMARQDLQQRLAARDQSYNGLAERLANVESQLAERDATCRELTEIAANLSERLSSSVAENDELKKRLMHSDEEVRVMTFSKEGLQTRLSAEEASNRIALEKLARSEDENKLLVTEAETLGRTLASASETTRAWEVRAANLASELASVTSSRDDARAMLAASEESKRDLMESFENERTKLTNDLRSVKEKLERAVRHESQRSEALASATRAMATSERWLQDLMECVVQIHRRELGARKKAVKVLADAERLRRGLPYRLGEIVLKHRPSSFGWVKAIAEIRAEYRHFDVGNVDANAAALAPVTSGAIRFLSSQETLSLPLTRKAQEVTLSSEPRLRELWATILSRRPGSKVTIELTTGVDGQPGTHRRIGLALGDLVRLVDIPPSSTTTVRLHRVRGEFCVIKLGLRDPQGKGTQILDAKCTPSAAAQHDRDETAVSGYRSHAEVDGPRSLPAAELEQKLWGGYAKYAIPALETIVADFDTSIAERENAAWYLARWFYVHEDYARALREIECALSLRSKPRRRFTLVQAQCLNNLGRYDEAKVLLEGAMNTSDSADFPLLYSTVVRNVARSRRAPMEACDAAQLRALNEVLLRSGLAPLVKRDPAAPLGLSNIGCDAEPRLTDQNEKVSVIMPAFNAAETIEWVIESLLRQTWKNLEIIVIDDLSTDATAKIVEGISRSDSRVQLVRKSVNRGAYAARNSGLQKSSGDLVIVHDSDDWSHPQRIELQIEALRKNPEVVAVKSHWVRVGPDLAILGPWIPKGTLFDLNFSSLLFRRTLLKVVGQWDEVLVGGDAEFYSRLQSRFGRNCVLKLPQEHLLAFALTRENSLTRAKATHLRTFYFGLRWNYLDSYHSWHVRLSDAKLPLAHDPTGKRQFPIPLANKPGVKALQKYGLVVVSDWARDDDSFTRALECLESAGRRGENIAVFHWRTYGSMSRAPLQSRFYEACLEFDVDILSPGDCVEAQCVLVGLPDILQRKIEPMPEIKCGHIVVLVHGDVASSRDTTETYDPTIARAHLKQVFGTEGMWLPVSERARHLMASDGRFPADAPPSEFPFFNIC